MESTLSLTPQRHCRSLIRLQTARHAEVFCPYQCQQLVLPKISDSLQKDNMTPDGAAILSDTC